MDTCETPLAMAQRHVTEGEARVSRQKALVAGIQARGFDMAQTSDVLGCLRRCLEPHVPEPGSPA